MSWNKGIGIIGAGAWGTALAAMGRRAGLSVVLWARESEVVESINKHHENTAFLPGIKLDQEIRATSDIAEAAAHDILFLVTPGQALRSVSRMLQPHVRESTAILICAKGLERGTRMLMSDVLRETVPQARPMVLSGPTFAADVASGRPTAITLAAETEEQARPIAEMIAGTAFRPYLSDDLTGVQIGGALKNVLAIACGIVSGRKLGESARAALMTRAFAELSRFASELGAQPGTMAGLSGLGDLILTCSSIQSRNMSLGFALGEGRSLDEVLGSRNSVSEGVYTAAVIDAIARERGIDMPIAQAVHHIVEGDLSIDEAIDQLMSRPIRAE